MAHCAYILNDNHCKRHVQSSSKYCFQHQPKKLLKRKSPIKDIQNLYFSSLPLDLYCPLFLYFSPNELLQLLPQLAKIPNFIRLFSYTPFWTALWKRDISTIITAPHNAYEKYKEIFYHLNTFSSKYEEISYFAQNGYDILLLPILLTLDDYNVAMAYAADGGQIEIVKLMIEKGANTYNWAMRIAAWRGHMEIVRLMLNLGANNYNDAMASAAESGHIEIVRLMLEKSANNYNTAMNYAAYGGHIEIVRLMLEKGANNYNTAIANAARGDHIEIVRLMLESGANDYNWAMLNSRTKEIKALIKSFMK